MGNAAINVKHDIQHSKKYTDKGNIDKQYQRAFAQGNDHSNSSAYHKNCAKSRSATPVKEHEMSFHAGPSHSSKMEATMIKDNSHDRTQPIMSGIQTPLVRGHQISGEHDLTERSSKVMKSKLPTTTFFSVDKMPTGVKTGTSSQLLNATPAGSTQGVNMGFRLSSQRKKQTQKVEGTEMRITDNNFVAEGKQLIES